MTVTFRAAKRENVPLLIGLAGASGSGKTYSALRLAKGIAGGKRFALLDTENGRAKHYADEFDFDHADLPPPFRPDAYLQAIQDAEKAGYDVIVVDSASHEYSGRGGLLDWQQEELARLAGDDPGKQAKLSAPAWTKPKLAHARFVSELLRVQAHILLCFRARQAIEIAKENGRTVVRPTTQPGSLDGWLIDTEHTRMPLHFELTTSFMMLPDQPGVPRPIKLGSSLRKFVPLDKPLDEHVGAELAKWAAGDAIKPTAEDKRVVELVQAINGCADKLGNQDVVTAAIAKNRRAHIGDPAAHVTWLETTLAAAEARVVEAARAADDDPFADLPPEESPEEVPAS